jgi:hypothetical protein
MRDRQRPEHAAWTGRQYRSQPLRLFLLGKAHYGVSPDEDSTDFTKELLGRVRAGTTHEPFFTRTALLVGAALNPPIASPSDVWDRVAFANYIPENVGPGVRDRPTPAMWERASSRLGECLEALAPTHLLSLGKEQWNEIQMPPGWTSVPLRQTAVGTIRVWRSRSRSIIATPIDHPTASFGFSPDQWLEHIKLFLSRELAAEVGV